MADDLELYIEFKSASGYYAIHVDHVAEVLEKKPITPYPCKDTGHIGITNIRGQILPVLSPAKLGPLQSKHSPYLMVVSGKGGQFFGLCIEAARKVRHTKMLPLETYNIASRPVECLVPECLFSEKEAA